MTWIWASLWLTISRFVRAKGRKASPGPPLFRLTDHLDFLARLSAFFCLADFTGAFLTCFFEFCVLAIFFPWLMLTGLKYAEVNGE